MTPNPTSCPSLPASPQQTEGYGGPPPSPVVQSWERGGYAGLDEQQQQYMRQDPGILPGTGTPIASGASGSGEAGFIVSGG